MISYSLSAEDREFVRAFESGRIAPEQFDHRSHVRLAYAYLVESGTDAAVARMRAALLSFLAHHRIASTKFHETLTHAWVMAVRHFMEISTGAASADGFIAANPPLLDTKIMLTHYSAEVLFSDRARAGFVEPDLGPIPRHDA